MLLYDYIIQKYLQLLMLFYVNLYILESRLYLVFSSLNNYLIVVYYLESETHYSGAMVFRS